MVTAVRHAPTTPARSRSAAPAPAGTPAEVAFREFWQTASRLRRLAEVRFAASGLSPAQWRVLRWLHEQSQSGNRGVRATDLCDALLLNKATVSGLIARLLRMGLVSRTHVQIDQRARAVQLTAAGRRVVASILVDHPAWTRNLMAGLSPAEQRVLTTSLRKLRRWLDPMVERTGCTVNGADRVPAPRGTVRRTELRERA